MLLLVFLSAYICMGLSLPPIEEERKHYGDTFSWRLSREAEFLEFIAEYKEEDKVVLWRRSDSAAGEGSRGRMEGRRWVMEKLTQDDIGVYTTYNTNRKLIQAKRIQVSERLKSLSMMTGEDVAITFNMNRFSSSLTFMPEDSWDASSYYIIRHGYLEDEYFNGRIQLLGSDESSFELFISDLKTSDTGHFQLQDWKGNLAMVVDLEVLASAPPSFYIGVAVGTIAVVVLFCCCVRKCCCKKNSSKTNSSVAQTAAAPAVYYHDNASEPAGPKYLNQPPAPTYPTQAPTYPSQSAGSAYPSGPSYSGPSYSFHSPLVHNPTDINVTSPQPEVPATAGQGAAPTVPIGSDCLSSDSGPRFELKGLNFPSAPPLHLDTSICNVYTSNKLNFL